MVSLARVDLDDSSNDPHHRKPLLENLTEVVIEDIKTDRFEFLTDHFSLDILSSSLC